MEDWVTKLDVQSGFEALTPTKTGFCEIPLPCYQRVADVKKLVFEQNSAPNYLTKTKLNMGRLDFNAKKSFSGILEFPVLRAVRGNG